MRAHVTVLALLGLAACHIQTGTMPEPSAEPAAPPPEPAPQLAEPAPAPPEPASASAALSAQPEQPLSTTHEAPPAAPASAEPDASAKTSTDESKNDKGKADKGKADKGKADKGKGDEGKADKGKADKGKADKGKHDAAKDDERSEPVETASPTTPAGPASSGTTPSDQRTVQRIQVRIEGSDIGVASFIKLVGSEPPFAETAESGIAEPGKPCSPNDRFEVRPKMPSYLGVDPKPCATQLLFDVPMAQAVYMLADLGDDAMDAGNPALAQAYYAVAAKRLRRDDPARAAKLLIKANEAAAKALGTISKGKRLNREAMKALQTFQKSEKLPETGDLDDLTRHRLSGIDEPKAMKDANEAVKRKAPLDELKPGAAEAAKPTRTEPLPAEKASDSTDAERLRQDAPRLQPRGTPTPGPRPKLELPR